MEECKLLINIDCLFDTYFSTVIDINPDWAIPLAKADYLERNHNYLSLLHPAIDDDKVKERYESRDLSILKSSKKTNIVDIIRDRVAMSKANPTHPEAIDFVITINTYPYVLPKEDLLELFSGLKYIWDIKTLYHVHLHSKDLKPEFIKKTFDKFMLYDFDEWFQYHQELFKHFRMPNVGCIIPYKTVKEHVDKRYDNESIKLIKRAFNIMFDLEIMPLGDMSFKLPIKQETTDANNPT